jgi:3-oxoacyl-[acyl-carrier protein] reductase
VSTSSPLAERVVVVTGAGRGLGLITVRTLLERGAHVVANHRSPSDDLVKLAVQWPDGLSLVPGDIAVEGTAERVIEQARRAGGPDAVVSNAAVTRDGPLVRMPSEDWDEVIRVNLRGAFLITKFALREMIRRRRGTLIYVSSVSAVMGNAGQANYAASKAALDGLSKTVAQEYGTRNIRSVVVAPGLLDTGLGDQLSAQVHAQKAGRSLRDVGSAAGVASTIAFLLGDDAGDLNATTLRLDGGIRY